MDPLPPNRPTRREVRRLRWALLGALILAWATHLLTTQWAGGAIHVPSSFQGQAAAPDSVLLLHLRARAEVRGPHVTLADVAFIEWNGPAVVRGLGELPIEPSEPAQQEPPAEPGDEVVSLEQIIAALEAAGVDLEQVQVHGPVRCQVKRLAAVESAPPQVDSDAGALLAWAGSGRERAEIALVEPEPKGPREAGSSAPKAPPPARSAEFIGRHNTVGEVLRRDLARRLELPVEQIQLRFAPEDMGLLQRTGVEEADVRALSAGDLGSVAWSVRLEGREIPIMADASATAWRAVAVQRIAARQVVRTGDVIGQQGRVDRLADMGVSPSAAVGQEAVRQLEAGQVVREEDLAPRLLVQAGQLISVQEMRYGTAIRGLAKALDDGWHGQLVRAQREGSDEIVQVQVTAPQAGRIVDFPSGGAAASGEGEAIPPH